MKRMTALAIPDNTVPEIRRVRHALQVRVLTVAAVQALTPHLRRLTLAGDSLADLHSEGFDDHVKLLLPAPGQRTLELPPPGPDGRPDFAAAGLPAPIARDYTPRRVDRAARTLDIEFSLHGDGPAARWAAQAQVGDTLHVAGPRGSMVVPTDLRWQWLIGDESALPAIARRLEELPADVDVTVVVETAAPDEPLPPLALGPRRRLVRVARPEQGDAAALAAPLLQAVRALATPAGRGHAFAAAENRSVKAVREVLAGHHGLHKGQIRASAYWQRGASGHHENLEG
jgi:NADPH-dependent ferric siderophore reductase